MLRITPIACCSAALLALTPPAALADEVLVTASATISFVGPTGTIPADMADERFMMVLTLRGVTLGGSEVSTTDFTLRLVGQAGTVLTADVVPLLSVGEATVSVGQDWSTGKRRVNVQIVSASSGFSLFCTGLNSDPDTQAPIDTERFDEPASLQVIVGGLRAFVALSQQVMVVARP